MKFENGNELLGFPKGMKIGLELETENTRGSEIKKIAEKMGWRYDKDPSLTDSGAEFVSPVLSEDDPEVWAKVSKMCDEIKAHPHDERGAYTDATCGGHIHFDSKLLTDDPKKMENFLKIWSEAEEIIYKMCNPKGEAIRESALQNKKITAKDYKEAWKTPPGFKNLKDIWNSIKTIKENISNETNIANTQIADALFSRKGFASPVGAKLQAEEANKNGNVVKRTIHKARGSVDKFLAKYKFSSSRYNGLNLSNIGNKKKNTIEFRMSNGTIDINEIKKNAFLYASIINTAVEMTEHPEEYQERLDNFFRRDVSQDEKAEAFLGLVMDSNEDKAIFMERYESVKDHAIYRDTAGAQMFPKGVFKKEDFSKIAQKESSIGIENQFNKIKALKNLKEHINQKDVRGEEYEPGIS